MLRHTELIIVLLAAYRATRNIHKESLIVLSVLMFLKMDKQKSIWQSRFYTVPRAYMSLIGIWPYHAFRVRCLLFVPMFTFSISILVPQVRGHKLYQATCLFFSSCNILVISGYINIYITLYTSYYIILHILII